MEERMNYLPLICTLIGAAGVLFSIIIASIVRGAPAGSEKMNEIAGAIKAGAVAYLNRQLKSMGTAGIVLFIIIGFALSWKTAVGFLIGATASFIAGYIGMRVSVIANVRTAEAAKGGLAKGLSMAFKGGTVTGMIVAGCVGLLHGAAVYRDAAAGGGDCPGGSGVRRQLDIHFCTAGRRYFYQGCRRGGRPGRQS